MREPIRCRHCGDVVGVYEPLVALIGGSAHETSLAVDATLAEREADFYHRACYEIHRHTRPSGE